MSINIKKAAITGVKFQIAENLDYIFKISKHGEEVLTIYSNSKFLGIVKFSYKNMIISIHDSGIDFTTEIRLKDINFIEC